MTQPNLPPETIIRRNLAACYRLIDHFGMSDLVSTHITARVPESEMILINRFGLLFSEITASNLVPMPQTSAKGDGVNPAGHLIHSAIHSARDDIGCVIHTHTAAGIAVACQKGGLLPISQHSLQFYNRIGYHEYEGVALGDAEKARLVDDLGGNDALILRNHGLLTVGRTIGEAFMLMFNLERACQIQVRALAGGVPLVGISSEVCELTAQQHVGFAGMEAGEPEWPALMRLVQKIAPDFAD